MEDEMVRDYHQLNEQESEQTPGNRDREDWRAAVHGVVKSQTRLSNSTTTRDRGGFKSTSAWLQKKCPLKHHLKPLPQRSRF